MGQKNNSFYRPEIDGLRALAVIAVIINHIDPERLPSGFLGVDIFFVISGFVVTASLGSKPEQSWKDYFLNFYSRRVKRLFPALVTCVVVTSLVYCLFIYRPSNALTTGITALIGLSNLYLFKESTDYFGSSAELNPFTHTWSLGVEEQFYFVFPVLLALCGFTRKKRKGGARNVVFSVLALSVASLVIYLALAGKNPSAAFFLTPTRFWEIGLGCLMFFASQKVSRDDFKRPRLFLSLLTLGAAIGLLFLSRDLQTVATLGIAFSTAILLWALSPMNPVTRLLSMGWFTQIGLLSYSLYLWHWPVLAISRWTVGISAATLPWQLLLILLLALVSYNGIEKPLRHWQWSAKKIKTIGYGLTASLMAVVLLLGLGPVSMSRALYLGDMEGYVHPPEFPELPSFPEIPGTSVTQENCLTRFTGRNKTEITDADLDLCRLEKEDSQKSVYVYGDSIAAQYAPMIARLRKEYPINVEYITRSGCPFPSRAIDDSSCHEFSIARRERLLNSAKEGDIVIIGRAPYPQFTYTSDYQSQLIDLMAELNQRGIVAVFPKHHPGFLEGFPDLCYEPLQWFNRSRIPTCTEPVVYRHQDQMALLEPINQQLAELSDQTGLHLWDPMKLICNEDEDVCSTHINGFRAYSDNAHLSTAAVEYLYDDFLQFLQDRSLL